VESHVEHCLRDRARLSPDALAAGVKQALAAGSGGGSGIGGRSAEDRAARLVRAGAEEALELLDEVARFGPWAEGMRMLVAVQRDSRLK